MVALRQNFVFLSFPLSLVALGIATRGLSENAAVPSDTHGLPPVVIYFVALLILGALSIFLALAGRVLRRSTSKPGTAGIAMRLFFYSPLLLTSCAVGLVSAGYVLNSLSGVAACLLALISMAGAFLLFFAAGSRNKA